MPNLDQRHLGSYYEVPPSRANILVKSQILFTHQLKTAKNDKWKQPIDWREKKISSVLDQLNCGDCWALSSTAALTDRFIIQKGLTDLRLEPAVTSQCVKSTYNVGCQGGFPGDAGQYFEEFGLPEISSLCPPWKKLCNVESCILPTCEKINEECKKPNVFYKAIKGSTRTLSVKNSDGSLNKQETIDHMKKELQNGPFVCSFYVPIDFIVAASLKYFWTSTNGVYINGSYDDDMDKIASPRIKNSFGIASKDDWSKIAIDENGQKPAHAVEVVGWGIDNINQLGNVEYWIVKNSWSTKWGDDGYFKIAMNSNDSNFNSSLAFDIPLLENSQYFGGATVFDPDLSSGRETPQTPVFDNKNNKTKPKSKRRGLIILLCLLIILIILISIIIYKNR
jgi:hypothetical protein